MALRIAAEAETELDEIWLYVASDSGSIEAADRLIDSIAARLLLLARNPHIGRRRDEELRPELRTFVVNGFVIIYRTEGSDVLILHVVRGSRDIAGLLGE
jgi:toxin ParE1/3/4